MDAFLRFKCTSPEQECILFQPDVGVDDEKGQPATSQLAAAREEFARPTKKRQQQRMTTWTIKQSKQFDPGSETITSLSRGMSVAYTLFVWSFFLCLSAFSYIFSVLFEKRVQEARIIFTGCESDWDANQMHELLYQDRSMHRRHDLHQRRLYSVPRRSFVCLT